ncbi:YggS family pyridoxal phosphate-dependent enzyme [Bacillus lacus]|uniref:Pyridoxal phosphate homeostasis protein n=1 Tax=Metabacillus lacus TaxID=1983721 RepID=A0A7X2J0R7_9BACI|nr:YggS family pyridoxal phosphate-dependent enzyme [Metabacillus lacus]MRX73320.1 YggS family pyridoxal phosphate-dependent enzyme [Metabacillus lacus]
MNVKNSAEEIKNNIKIVCAKTGRDPSEITIIAVTKYVSVERAKEAAAAGITALGENRAEGLLEKYEALGSEAQWHFIGSLQTRKVKEIIDKVTYIHSVDRLSLAREISKRAAKPIKCFVQVNTSGEESKSGLQPDETVSFIESLQEYEHIEVAGLMTMAPLTDDEEVLRNCFSSLRKLRDAVNALQLKHAPCTELSMGMSNDYKIAVEEGATFVRIGSALVGNSNGGG